MIIQDNPVALEISGTSKPNKFKITASKIAFDILSKGLYSNNYAAIIRELSTNAYDSHVAAGKKDEPIQVHLPTSFEPYFSVRDNGLGLSPENVEKIYTVYFESNKRDSNDFNGCLGLGSKSPFSYVDQFTVESRYNGKKYIYSCFKNATGEPDYAQLSETETKECNGVEVKLGVRNYDFQQFYSNAQLYRWFKVKPKLTGTQITYPINKYLFETEKYQVCETTAYKSQLIMGNVCYPIDSSKAGITNNQYLTLLNWGVNLYVPIGEVEFTANRESLNYDENTTKVLNSALADILIDTKKLADESLKNAKTLWEARKVAYKNQHNLLYKLHGSTNLTWQGKNVEFRLYIPQSERDNKAKVEKVEQYRKRKSKEELTSLIPNDNPLYYNDLPMGGISRIDNEIKTKGIFSAYILTGFSEKWLKNEGLYDLLIKATTLPKPIHAARTGDGGRNYSKIYTYKMMPGYHNAGTEYWEDVKLDLNTFNQGGVYLEILRYFIQKKGGVSEHPKYVYQTIQTLNKIKPHIIYGIRPDDAEKISKKYTKWIKLEDYCKKILEEKTVIDKLSLANEYDNLQYSYNYVHFKGEMFKHDSIFGSFLNRFNVCLKESTDLVTCAYKNLYGITGATIKWNPDKLAGLHKLVNKAYPLLQYLNISKQNANAISDYIREIDAKPA